MDFEKFCAIVMPFLEEDDDEAMHEELKEAFRLYDKGGKCLRSRLQWERESRQERERTRAGEFEWPHL